MTLAGLRCAAPGMIVATAVLLPFLNKAFTIDDTLFLRQAEHLLTDPLHPTAFEMVWSEAPVPRRVSQFMPTGPIMAYLLLPAVVLDGAEWAAHAVQIAMMGMAVFATATLGRRMGLGNAQATMAGILLATTPAALAMAGTAMPDVPAMALGALGLERLYAWKQQRRWHQCLVAAAALALAPLARPHLVLMLFIGGLVMAGDARHWRQWSAVKWFRFLPIVLAPLITFVLMAMTRDPEGGTADVSRAAWQLSSINLWRINLIAFAIHWVLVLPRAIPWVLLRGGSLLTRPSLFAALAALAAATALAVSSSAGRSAFWIAPVAALGAAVLWDIVVDAWKRRDMSQGLLAAWLVVALPIALYVHMPSKYLLASAPAAALLIVTTGTRHDGRWAMGVVALSCALGLALGILILRADARFAGLGRRAATDVIAPQVAAGKHVWFSGHWGFQWYAEKAGARCLTTTPPHPDPGDVAVSSLRAFGLSINEFPNRRFVHSLAEATPGGRLMSTKHGAGFYSNGWGYLPWAWGTDEIERFDVWVFD